MRHDSAKEGNNNRRLREDTARDFRLCRVSRSKVLSVECPRVRAVRSVREVRDRGMATEAVFLPPVELGVEDK